MSQKRKLKDTKKLMADFEEELVLQDFEEEIVPKQSFTGEELESGRQQEAAQKQQAQFAAQLQAQQEEAQKADPTNWSSKQLQDHFKQNPPQNIQEQAQADAALEMKKKQEEQIKTQITGLPKDVKEESFDINVPGNVVKNILNSPLVKSLKTIPLAGPVSPGVIEAQLAPGRAILAPYAELAKEPLFKIGGVTATPFVNKQIFDDIDKKIGNAILGYTSPGQDIVKESMGALAELNAFASTMSGTVGTLSSLLEASGILKPEKAGQSAGTKLLGTQLELMSSPNLLALVDYPFRVRYKIANEIFDEIGKFYKANNQNLVVDEAQFMKWAESKSPSELRKILDDLKAGKYTKGPEAPKIETKAPKPTFEEEIVPEPVQPTPPAIPTQEAVPQGKEISVFEPQPLKPSSVKSQVREATGQTTSQKKTLTEAQALRRSLRRQEQASNVSRITERKYQKEVHRLINKIKKADIQGMTAKERFQIEQLQKELKKTRTLDGLRALNEKVQKLKELGKERYLATKEAKDARFQLDKEILIKTMRGGKEPPPKRPVLKQERPRIRKAVGPQALRPQRVFDKLDKGQTFNGPHTKFFYDRINKAYTNEVAATNEFNTRATQIFAKNKITPQDISSKKTIDGAEFTMDQMMHIYAATGNQENLMAVIAGNKIPLATIDKIVKQLPDNFKQAADEIVGELEANYDRTRVAYLDFTDGKTDLGRVEGTYVPMKRTEVDYQTTDEELFQELAQRTAFKRAFAERSFTKQRIQISPEHQKPIRLGLSEVYFDHVQKREHFIQMGSIIKEAQRMANDGEWSGAVRELYGPDFLNVVRHYVNQVANSNIYRAANGVEKAIQTFRKNSATAYLGWNLVTMGKQLPSVMLFLGDLGPVELMWGIDQAVRNFEGTKQFIDQRDPQMANRQIEREMEEFRRTNPEKYERLISKLGRTAFNGIRFFDRLAINSGWIAKYNQMIQRGASEEEAIQQAQKLVLRTQPAAAAKDLPVLYTQNEFLNTMLQFTNQLNQIWNIVTYDIPTAAAGGQWDRAFLGALGVALNSAVIWSATHGRLPEKEELGNAFAENLIQAVPIIGPMINAWRRGFDALPPILDFVKTVTTDIPKDVVRWAGGAKTWKGQKSARDRSIRNFVTSVGVYKGLPINQFIRTMRGIYNLVTGQTEDLRRLIYSEYALKKPEK